MGVTVVKTTWLHSTEDTDSRLDNGVAGVDDLLRWRGCWLLYYDYYDWYYSQSPGSTSLQTAGPVIAPCLAGNHEVSHFSKLLISNITIIVNYQYQPINNISIMVYTYISYTSCTTLQKVTCSDYVTRLKAINYQECIIKVFIHFHWNNITVVLFVINQSCLLVNSDMEKVSLFNPQNYQSNQTKSSSVNLPFFILYQICGYERFCNFLM